MNNLGAILLAAGQSRRMGAFKPLLPFGKHSVIEACLDYLVEGGIAQESIVVVVGHRAEDIQRSLEDSCVIFSHNRDVASEMNASITVGVQALPPNCRAVLIALVDYPAIPGTVVSRLRLEWEGGARLVKPTYQGSGGHPVLIDMCFRNELLNLNPNRGLKGFFEAHKDEVRRIEVDSPYIARDIDTWDDYARLHSEVFGQAAPEPDENPSNESPARLI